MTLNEFCKTIKHYTHIILYVHLCGNDYNCKGKMYKAEIPNYYSKCTVIKAENTGDFIKVYIE